MFGEICSREVAAKIFAHCSSQIANLVDSQRREVVEVLNVVHVTTIPAVPRSTQRVLMCGLYGMLGQVAQSNRGTPEMA